MKLVADEGVDKPIVDHLRSLGYQIIYVLESAPGLADDDVLSMANEEKAILLTMDTDFGELIFRLKESTHGVLLLRLAGLTAEQKQQITASALETHEHEIAGNFSVVTKNSIRIRKL